MYLNARILVRVAVENVIDRIVYRLVAYAMNHLTAGRR